MNRVIFAIGGGDITKLETYKLDKEIVKISGKKMPTVLFIPTASVDSEAYIDSFTKLYRDKLGCIVKVLTLYKNRPTSAKIEKLIFNSDIIYVGGGNTLRMMKLWRKLGIDKLLVRAYEKGIIMSGLSAGAICWFSYGHSDSKKYSAGKNADFIKVKGLGIQNFIICPHYHKENREDSFAHMLKKNRGLKGIALDNNTAIKITDNSFKISKSNTDARAYEIVYNFDKLTIKELSD